MNTIKNNIRLLILSTSLMAMSIISAEEDIIEAEEIEEVKEYIQDLTKDFSRFEGFFEAYQDPETSDIYLVIKKEQLNKEFIYFAHVIDGVVASRRNKGSYLDNGVFKIEKYFNTLRLSRINTSFTLNKDTALSKSSGQIYLTQYYHRYP